MMSTCSATLSSTTFSPQSTESRVTTFFFFCHPYSRYHSRHSRVGARNCSKRRKKKEKRIKKNPTQTDTYPQTHTTPSVSKTGTHIIPRKPHPVTVVSSALYFSCNSKYHHALFSQGGLHFATFLSLLVFPLVANSVIGREFLEGVKESGQYDLWLLLADVAGQETVL